MRRGIIGRLVSPPAAPRVLERMAGPALASEARERLAEAGVAEAAIEERAVRGSVGGGDAGEAVGVSRDEMVCPVGLTRQTAERAESVRRAAERRRELTVLRERLLAKVRGDDGERVAVVAALGWTRVAEVAKAPAGGTAASGRSGTPRAEMAGLVDTEAVDGWAEAAEVGERVGQTPGDATDDIKDVWQARGARSGAGVMRGRPRGRLDAEGDVRLEMVR